MKPAFLVDANLPVALARMIAGMGWTCRHVVDLGSDDLTDSAIWQVAARDGLTIISKDVDFADLALGTPSGPSVLWVRMGNTRKDVLLERFRRDIPEFCEHLAAGNRLIEIA